MVAKNAMNASVRKVGTWLFFKQLQCATRLQWVAFYNEKLGSAPEWSISEIIKRVVKRLETIGGTMDLNVQQFCPSAFCWGFVGSVQVESHGNGNSRLDVHNRTFTLHVRTP
jgi:hypothetical protein